MGSIPVKTIFFRRGIAICDTGDYNEAEKLRRMDAPEGCGEMERTAAFPGLTNNQLKLIAMAAMLLDHIGLQLLPEVLLLRVVGRLAFPIFAYMIAEGCAHTRHRPAYLLKIAGLAVGCQLVFFLTEGSWYQGILITFTLSVLTIFTVDWYRSCRTEAALVVMVLELAAVLALTLAMPEALARYGFQIDYGLCGVLLPVAVYYLPEKREKLLCTACVLSVMGGIFGGLQWFALLALPLLWLYNQQRGRLRLKYLFYIFYPTHLAAIWLAGLALG